MKKYFIFAASALALASCSSDDFLGENPSGAQGTSDVAIRFGGETGKITRATSNTGSDAQKLAGQFLLYGVKSTTGTEGKKFTDVFNNYYLWDQAVDGAASNTNGWEYVGTKGKDDLGTGKIKLIKDQTIKYWDYSSESYHFVAGSPISQFTFNQSEDGNIASASVSGLKGHLTAKAVIGETTTPAESPSPVYVAKPVVVAKARYKNVVSFDFYRQQSKVRVGFYETIPGYHIKSINFYSKGEDNSLTVGGTNVVLISTSTATPAYFVGGEGTGTITYNWTNQDYTFAYGGTATSAKNWYAGAMNGVQATSSTETDVAKLYGKDADMEDKGFFTVMPTPSVTEAAAILIKCDYVLESDDNKGETIKVTGATAAIPAAFSKWEPNTLYTYLFKISQNTNGTTGTGEDTPGLFPITFDAVVAQEADATHQGTTTTVQTPSITTNQEGSVTDKGIKYVAGKAITATVTENTTGDVKGITDATVKVYKLTKVRTEAELQMANVFATEITDQTPLTISINNNVLSFTPEEGYYAIQYQTAAAGEGTQAAYTYKIVHVEAAPSPSVNPGN